MGPSLTWFYLVLPSFTGFYWVLLGFTDVHRVLLGFYSGLLGLERNKSQPSQVRRRGKPKKNKQTVGRRPIRRRFAVRFKWNEENQKKNKENKNKTQNKMAASISRPFRFLFFF